MQHSPNRQRSRHPHRPGPQRHHPNRHPPQLHHNPKPHSLLPQRAGLRHRNLHQPPNHPHHHCHQPQPADPDLPLDPGRQPNHPLHLRRILQQLPHLRRPNHQNPRPGRILSHHPIPHRLNHHRQHRPIHWTIATGAVLLTGYTQAAALYPSATEIDFGTQYPGAPHLPRDLYLSNNSTTAIPHAAVTLSPPFTLTDLCPSTLEPHTVCQLQLTYESPISPSADSTTLTLDQGITVLVTGTTLPQPTGIGQSVNPSLTLTPTTITFPNAVPVTSTSNITQTITVGNAGAQPFPLTLALTGDFTDTTNCPAILPGNQTCLILVTFAPSHPGTRQGLLSVTAGTATTPAYVSLSGTGTAILPSGTLDFGNVLVGQPSVQWYKISQSFTTLTASTSSPQFATILVEDTGFGHGQTPSTAFAPSYTGTCANCWLGVQFTPTQTGPETATLNLSSTTSGNASPVTLTGIGIPSTGLLLTPTTQDFGPIPVNSHSAPTLFTLTNQTPATITFTTPTITGDFTLSPTTPTGGQPCTGTLAPTVSCFLQIAFAPTTTGPRTGTLTLQTSASTLTAPLTGFGSPDTGLALNPTALTFINVPGPTATQQTITLTNTSPAPIQIAPPTTATPNFAAATTCATLAPAATCTITVTFTPTTANTTDTLQIPATSTANGLTTYTVPLTGAYTTQNAGLQITPTQSEYGPAPTSTFGPTRQFTINNLTAKSLALSLTLPRQFTLTTPACATLTPNGSCTFSVAFLPLTNGDITGTLFAQATPTDGTATLNGLAFVEGYGIGSSSLAITGNIIPNTGVLNFGQVTSGQSSPQTLTLTNQGASPVTVRRITSEWPFLSTATTCGATLAPNQSCTVTLAYTPLNQAATGTTSPQSTHDTGALTIESDALTSPQTINLTGTAAPILLSTPANTAPLVSYTASQNSLTFPSTQVGNASPSQTLTLTNTGTTTIRIAALQTTPDFTFQSTCNTLLPGDTCPITVTFTPQAATTNSTAAPPTRISALQITSDASNALDFISLYGTAAPAALTLAPLSLNFGTVQLGTTAQLPLQITNTSAAPATFNSITTTGDYTATGTCPTPGGVLAPSATCALNVTFAPTQTGTRTGALSLSTSLSTFPLTAALSGIGSQSHLQITPTSLTFANTAIGSSTSLTFTLANTGTSPITNLIFSITGDYAITTPCTFGNLAPAATCRITVTFTPTALGSRTGTLVVTSSDTNSPARIPLTGTGIPASTFLLTANGGPTATATVALEDPATFNLQLIPQSGYSGTIVLNCTPITPGQYATCSLLPSTIALNGATQGATATINNITAIPPTTTASNTRTSGQLVLCLLPTALLFFWRNRKPRNTLANRASPILWTLLFTATTLFLSSRGSGGDPNLRRTPPGTYQYKVTATSTTGIVTTQTVTLNLIVATQ